MMIRNGWTQHKLDFVLEHMERDLGSRDRRVLAFWKWMTGNYGLWFSLTTDKEYLNGLLNLYEQYTYFDEQTRQWAFSMRPRRAEAARAARSLSAGGNKIVEPEMMAAFISNVDDEVRRRIGRKTIG